MKNLGFIALKAALYGALQVRPGAEYDYPLASDVRIIKLFLM